MGLVGVAAMLRGRLAVLGCCAAALLTATVLNATSLQVCTLHRLPAAPPSARCVHVPATALTRAYSLARVLDPLVGHTTTSL